MCGQSGSVEVDVSRLLRRLGAGLEALENLDTTFSFCCRTREAVFSSWRSLVESHVKRTPTFSALSNPATGVVPR